MAKVARTPLIFSCYGEVKQSGGNQEAQCSICLAVIKGKVGVTSNFVTHLKRKHPSKHDEYVKKKKESSVAQFSQSSDDTQTTQVTLKDMMTSLNKYDRNHTRQRAITDGIVNMIVKDLQPAAMVENKGFRDLIAILDPRYTIVSRQHIQYTLLPKRVAEVTAAIKLSLAKVLHCSVTVDIWSSRRMHAYLGITCHFISGEWKMVSHLLACRQMLGRHTGEKIISEFEAVLEEFEVRMATYKVVTDNASNMKKAFGNNFTLPGFDSVCIDDDIESDTETVEFIDEDEDREEDDSTTQLDTLMEKIPDRISCFAHTLQLCVKDGLTASARLTTSINKVARIVNHVKKSTVATEKLEILSSKALISKNETRWNSQLKMVRRVLQVEVNDLSEKKELHLSAFDKNILREFVEIFERFEDATDILQGDKYVSISLAIPCYLGLKSHLDAAKRTNRYSQGIITALNASLEKRLGSIMVEPLYCISTLLDPQFKLKWCNDVQCKQVKDMALEEMALLNSEQHAQEENDGSSSPPPPKKSKMSKLFSFLDAPVQTRPAGNCEEELEAYLNSDHPQSSNHSSSALSFWRSNADRFPKLSQLARKFLAVPATSAPVERVFSQAGKILRAERCRLLPKNFENLVFLKINQDFV